MQPGDVIALIAVCTAGVLVLRGPLGRALENLLGGRKRGAGLSEPELEDMRARLESVQELEQRVYELEERLEFAERLLAQPPKATKPED